MNEVSLLQTLGQVSASETGKVFRDFLRGQVREMICEVMPAEVSEIVRMKDWLHSQKIRLPFTDHMSKQLLCVLRGIAE